MRTTTLAPWQSVVLVVTCVSAVAMVILMGLLLHNLSQNQDDIDRVIAQVKRTLPDEPVETVSRKIYNIIHNVEDITKSVSQITQTTSQSQVDELLTRVGIIAEQGGELMSRVDPATVEHVSRIVKTVSSFDEARLMGIGQSVSPLIHNANTVAIKLQETDSVKWFTKLATDADNLMKRLNSLHELVLKLPSS